MGTTRSVFAKLDPQLAFFSHPGLFTRLESIAREQDSDPDLVRMVRNMIAGASRNTSMTVPMVLSTGQSTCAAWIHTGSQRRAAFTDVFVNMPETPSVQDLSGMHCILHALMDTTCFLRGLNPGEASYVSRIRLSDDMTFSDSSEQLLPALRRWMLASRCADEQPNFRFRLRFTPSSAAPYKPMVTWSPFRAKDLHYSDVVALERISLGGIAVKVALRSSCKKDSTPESVRTSISESVIHNVHYAIIDMCYDYQQLLQPLEELETACHAWAALRELGRVASGSSSSSGAGERTWADRKIELHSEFDHIKNDDDVMEVD